MIDETFELKCMDEWEHRYYKSGLNLYSRITHFIHTQTIKPNKYLYFS